MDDRARYIDGLRVFAAALEKHPEIPLPNDGMTLPLIITFFADDDPRAAMAAAARALPCAWRKKVSGNGTAASSYFDLEGDLAGLKLLLTAYRDDICERVVTGTREVTETVKDPGKLAAVPEITVTRTEETVEWRCGSVLAGAIDGARKAVTS